IYTMLKGIEELSKQRGINVIYHNGCDIMNEEDENIEEAVRIASAADIIISVVGDCLDQNGETKDRANLDLSGAQQKLLERLKSCGKPLVAVLVNGKPLSVPWIAKNADAVLETFNSGMYGGKALAEVVFGEVNPCGKLTISFPYHSGQLPVYYNQLPGWHGNKYVDMPDHPLYPFGYGLSYTEFKYSNLKLSKTKCSANDTIVASVEVTNTGKVDGKEIVQLYVNDAVSSVVTPIKELKGFKKVEIKASETKTVEIPLEISQLSICDENEKYVVEPGEFIIMVGPDSRDEVLSKISLVVE
ncbi:MAG TPA: glycoside hydrolase family 3 C-terminal domain-containing protein, partial [Clostridia bacterium]